jgi:hypothetical protein
MMIPMPILVLLVLMALPTAVVLAIAFNDWANSHTLRLFGQIDNCRGEGAYVSRFCVLYVPISWESGIQGGLFTD